MPRTLSRRALFGRAKPDKAEIPADTRLVAELAASCLSINGVLCGVCADACTPRALRVRPLVGGRALPMISASCTGCGECLTVCPVGALALVPGAPVPEENACA